MASSLKPYPAYKPSGVEWLGEVPVHWGLPRLGALLRERKEMNDGGQVSEVLSLLRNRGVIPYDEKGNVGNKKSEDITRYKVVRPDDIVVNCMNVIIGSVGLSSYTGCLSPVYYVLTRRSEHDHPRYLNAYFQTKPFQESLVRIGNGILAHRMRIPMELLKCEPFPHPPPEEQAAIARYLDRTDRRIRRCIQAAQRQIELLEEHGQALVHEAVTGRVDVRTGQPYPACKPSGVEWLGEVPAHWEVRRLGQMGTLSKGNGGSKEDEEPEGVPCVRYGDLYTTHTRFIWGSRSFVSRTRAADYTPLKHGDVLFAASGETIDEIGKSAVNLMSSEACCGGDIIVFRPRYRAHVPYMGYAADCWSSATQKATMGRGFTVVHIYTAQLKRLALPFPPLPEQAAIARYLDRADQRIRRCVQAAQRQIESLEEYRIRLIADVVTGKLDVREAAVALPATDPLAAGLTTVPE